jgi:type I restriction enzyme S subunit
VTASRDLVSSAPNIGRIVEVTGGKYIMAQGVNAIEPNKDKVNPKFLVHLSNSQLYRNHMKRIKVGSTQVHIRKDDFLSTPIPKPPIEEQSKIVDVISSSERQIREEKRRKEKLQSLKRGLMQDLLTGKVRNID